MLKKGRKAVLAAVAVTLGTAATSQAALVGQWKGDGYVTGQNWADSSGSGNIGLPANGTSTATPNAFNGHAGVTFGGVGYFNVANTFSNPTTPANALTLAAVFKPTTTGTSSGAQFWQNSGLIGNE